ncbi:hypothetical protein O1D19_001025 [Vibrio cholerae]|uniref:hypothetical protein n=1 Tax=Vibrio cholerae TaxID=666 RepID=UPI0012B180C9|nr:hypothetical protein [Vibrio cholerae]EHB5526042.1 hypothetical protein [Vibrio cholerae]EJL6304948.1 hypothetical protein [Vibrio cholerae]EJL6675760.1 hypothetical protein [Vibrio cholerae]EJL6875924.1 hypothetical protein [Vibrio cholerae]EJP3280424.1 hypothetical protein [Vibrio cholerae]
MSDTLMTWSDTSAVTVCTHIKPETLYDWVKKRSPPAEEPSKTGNITPHKP